MGKLSKRKIKEKARENNRKFLESLEDDKKKDPWRNYDFIFIWMPRYSGKGGRKGVIQRICDLKKARDLEHESIKLENTPVSPCVYQVLKEEDYALDAIENSREIELDEYRNLLKKLKPREFKLSGSIKKENYERRFRVSSDKLYQDHWRF